MGITSSRTIDKYKNDFELVIRASKELEFLLETEFNAKTNENQGLHDKISNATHMGRPLNPTLIKQVGYLTTILRKLFYYEKNKILL